MPIILCNDLLTGWLGEKVLWDFLLEDIRDFVPVDKRCNLIFPSTVKEYIDKTYPTSKIIVQNATFMPLIDNTKYTISYLQDNLRGMNRRDNCQEYVLHNSNLIIANSKYTAHAYSDYNTEIIPIGIDETLFKPLDKRNEKIVNHFITDKYGSIEKIGIFVGDFSEVKGWSLIKNIIDKRKDIYWILVSKDNQNYNIDNSFTYNKIDQNKLVSLLNCADFFIIGSPVETQCLAAIEACYCNIPVIMKNTGIFSEFSDEDKNRVGYIGDDFETGIEKVLSSKHNPLEVVQEHRLGMKDMIIKWKDVLNKVKKIVGDL